MDNLGKRLMSAPLVPQSAAVPGQDPLYSNLKHKNYLETLAVKILKPPLTGCYGKLSWNVPATQEVFFICLFRLTLH